MNNIPCNNDEHTYDPEALNIAPAKDYMDAAAKFISGYCADLRNVKTGRVEKHCVDGASTWTPGDVQIAHTEDDDPKCRVFDLPCQLDAEGREAGFLHRISVNYLRHRASRYDRMLNEIAGLPGVRDAYLVLFERMMLAIAARYPDLAAECQRQLERRAAIGASLAPVS